MIRRFLITIPFFLLFLGVWVLTYFSPITDCTFHPGFSFDSHNILAWKYAQTTNLVPTKDVFYPYGLLIYYKDTIAWVQLLASLLIPLHITITSVFISKVTRSRLKGLIGGILLFFFIAFFSDLTAFQRYGSAFSLILLSLLWQGHSKVRLFVLGLLTGLLFVGITDQGVLSAMVLGIGSTFTYMLERKTTFLKWIKNIPWKSTGYYISGGLAGLVPLVIWAIHTSSGLSFLLQFRHLATISIFAETPFLPYAFHPENLFVFIPLVLCITMLSYIFTFNRPPKLTFLHSALLFIAILTMLLEHRSLVRTVSIQIVFLGPILALLINQQLHERGRSLAALLSTAMMVLIFTWLGSSTMKSIHARGTMVFGGIANAPPHLCTQTLVRDNVRTYQYPQELLNTIPAGTPIYSFPADAALYVWLSSPLPPYLSTYEASPLFAQQQLVEWMRVQKVKTVVINTENLEMELIAHPIRTPFIFKHLMTSFCPQEMVGKFLLMKSCTNPTITAFEKVAPTYLTQLLQINIEEIPRKEWLFKRELLQPGSEHLPLNVTNLYMYVHDTAQLTELSLTGTALTTLVQLRHCDEGCVIHIENIPLFTIDNVLTAVEAPESATIEYLRGQHTALW